MICDKCRCTIDTEEAYNICGDCYDEAFPLSKPVPKKRKPKGRCKVCNGLYWEGKNGVCNDCRSDESQAPELAGIVNRPQFDLDYYKVGTAVQVEVLTDDSEPFNGIVLEVFADHISIGFFDNEGSADRYELKIAWVIDGSVKVRKFM